MAELECKKSFDSYETEYLGLFGVADFESRIKISKFRHFESDSLNI